MNKSFAFLAQLLSRIFSVPRMSSGFSICKCLMLTFLNLLLITLSSTTLQKVKNLIIQKLNSHCESQVHAEYLLTKTRLDFEFIWSFVTLYPLSD